MIQNSLILYDLIVESFLILNSKNDLHRMKVINFKAKIILATTTPVQMNS